MKVLNFVVWFGALFIVVWFGLGGGGGRSRLPFSIFEGLGKLVGHPQPSKSPKG